MKTTAVEGTSCDKTFIIADESQRLSYYVTGKLACTLLVVVVVHVSLSRDFISRPRYWSCEFRKSFLLIFNI